MMNSFASRATLNSGSRSYTISSLPALVARGFDAHRHGVFVETWDGFFFDRQAIVRAAIICPQTYVGPCMEISNQRRGQFIGMSGYGASAPIGVLLKHFGITVENVVAAAKKS